jgi:hypothetical protein
MSSTGYEEVPDFLFFFIAALLLPISMAYHVFAVIVAAFLLDWRFFGLIEFRVAGNYYG